MHQETIQAGDGVLVIRLPRRDYARDLCLAGRVRENADGTLVVDVTGPASVTWEDITGLKDTPCD